MFKNSRLIINNKYKNNGKTYTTGRRSNALLLEVRPQFHRDVLNQMPTPKPPYTSVASVVRNLEKKEYLSPFKLGNSIQYHPVIKESDYKRYFLSGVVSNYFTGSYKEMVSFFVRDRKISKKELEDLIDIIEDEES